MHISCLVLIELDHGEMEKSRHLQRIQSLLHEFDRLQLTPVEYAYLKLIVIFNPPTSDGKCPIASSTSPPFNAFSII